MPCYCAFAGCSTPVRSLSCLLGCFRASHHFENCELWTGVCGLVCIVLDKIICFVGIPRLGKDSVGNKCLSLLRQHSLTTHVLHVQATWLQ